MSVADTLGYEGYPLPVGTIFPFIGTTLPSAIETGCVPCDGAFYSPTDLPDLFKALGYAYGQSGDNFRVPILNVQDESFLIGGSFTNPVPVPENIVVNSVGATLVAANIPTIKSAAPQLLTFTTSGSNLSFTASETVRGYNSGSGTLSGIGADGVYPNINPVFINNTSYNNAVPTPVTRAFTATGTFNPQYVSIVYLIKARYALPPLTQAVITNIPPPTSNIYNANRQVGGFTDFGGAIQFNYY